MSQPIFRSVISACASGIRYYNGGSAYYQPHSGSNGVYYTVVANPF